MNRTFKTNEQRKRIFMILTILWMIFIFSFSARPADVSQQDSYRVGIVIGDFFVPNFSNWTEVEQMEFAKKVDHPIRKTAHAAEYAILGILIVGAYVDYQKKRKRTVFVPWILATGYAVTDEFHQLFVPGRSGQVTDVMIDSSGAATGVFLTTMVYLILNAKQSRMKQTV